MAGRAAGEVEAMNIVGEIKGKVGRAGFGAALERSRDAMASSAAASGDLLRDDSGINNSGGARDW
jgi:hypothetical protein